MGTGFTEESNQVDWYESNLRCPIDYSGLIYRGKRLVSENGTEYPIVDGIPVMLRPDVKQTIDLANASLARSRRDNDKIDQRFKDLHLESLGISKEEKESLVELYNSNYLGVDAVVSYLVGATSGHMYKDQIGQLSEYPIPELRIQSPNENDRFFLDVGCSWGRWSIAAAQKGFTVVGIDPSLGALLAARRVATQLELDIRFVCADARFLPLRNQIFDVVYSYSVLQHFSKVDVVNSLVHINRVLKPGGESLIQMPNSFGVRSLQHQLRRGFRQPKQFEVRYWKPKELLREFERNVGTSELSVDCFFGLGLQASDKHLMTRPKRFLIEISEVLRTRSERSLWLSNLADSVYVRSEKTCYL